MKIPKFLWPVGIIGAGLMLFAVLVATRPDPPPAGQVDFAPLVRAETVTVIDTHYRVPGQGTVKPAREVSVITEVSGPVIWVSDALLPGGRFKKGDPLFRIEPDRYGWAVARRRAELAQARTEFLLEKGRGEVARRDWQASSKRDRSTADSELALRKPQLEAASAMLASAQAGLDEAQLNLARTEVVAPFDGVVQFEDVTLGQLVQAGREVVRILDTREFWIEVAVPVAELSNFQIPESSTDQASAAVVVHQRGPQGTNFERMGQALGLYGALQEGSRMARLLVQVLNPLQSSGNGAPPLLVGEHVQVDVIGRELKGVIKVPRSAVMADQTVWALSAEDLLERRALKLAWRGPDHVFVEQGLSAGERVVIGTLARVTPGTRVRLLKAEEGS